MKGVGFRMTPTRGSQLCICVSVTQRRKLHSANSWQPPWLPISDRVPTPHPFPREGKAPTWPLTLEHSPGACSRGRQQKAPSGCACRARITFLCCDCAGTISPRNYPPKVKGIKAAVQNLNGSLEPHLAVPSQSAKPRPGRENEGTLLYAAGCPGAPSPSVTRQR